MKVQFQSINWDTSTNNNFPTIYHTRQSHKQNVHQFRLTIKYTPGWDVHCIQTLQFSWKWGWWHWRNDGQLWKDSTILQGSLIFSQSSLLGSSKSPVLLSHLGKYTEHRNGCTTDQHCGTFCSPLQSASFSSTWARVEESLANSRDVYWKSSVVPKHFLPFIPKGMQFVVLMWQFALWDDLSKSRNINIATMLNKVERFVKCNRVCAPFIVSESSAIVGNRRVTLGCGYDSRIVFVLTQSRLPTYTPQLTLLTKCFQET